MCEPKRTRGPLIPADLVSQLVSHCYQRNTNRLTGLRLPSLLLGDSDDETDSCQRVCGKQTNRSCWDGRGISIRRRNTSEGTWPRSRSRK